MDFVKLIAKVMYDIKIVSVVNINIAMIERKVLLLKKDLIQFWSMDSMPVYGHYNFKEKFEYLIVIWVYHSNFQLPSASL